MSVTVAPLHAYDSPAHLEHVVAEMERRGPPKIRAYLDVETGAWIAREGTHRLRAAMRLGVAPALISIPWWRSRSALVRARFAALIRGHDFARVEVVAPAAALV